MKILMVIIIIGMAMKAGAAFGIMALTEWKKRKKMERALKCLRTVTDDQYHRINVINERLDAITKEIEMFRTMQEGN